MLNEIGPSIDPSGTPNELYVWLGLVRCFLLER